MRRFFLVSLVFLFSSLVLAGKYPDKVKFEDITVYKRGDRKISFLFFDIYNIAYYKSKDQKAELLYVKYLRDISKDMSLKGWDKGFEYVPGKDNAKKWIHEHTTDMEEKTEFLIWKFSKSKTVFQKDKKIIGVSFDPDVYYLAHYPWIGKKALDSSIKKSLLK